MPNADLSALQRAWPMISHVISLLHVRLGSLGATAKQRWQVLHLARLAESLMRRWLMLKACTGEAWPKVKLANPPTPATASRPVIPERAQALIRDPDASGTDRARLGPGYFRKRENSGMTMQVPLFALYEPERAMRFLDETPDPQAAGAACPPVFNPENLKRRCAALNDVITAPERHIKRMARWLARAAARCKTRFGRIHPLRISWPPGSSRRLKRLDPERQGMLGYLDALARQAMVRCGSP